MNSQPRDVLKKQDFFPELSHSEASIVVPVFNEAPKLIQNIELLIHEVEPYFKDYGIIIMSDGSTDETDAILKQIQYPHVKVVTFTQNRGKGYVVKQGFKMAKFDYLFFIDGGMELHPKELKVFLAIMSIYQADIVIGSKRHPQSVVSYPSYRKFLSFIYQWVVRLLFQLNVTDTQVGLKLFKKKVIDAILDDLVLDRYGFDVEILALAERRGFHRVMEAPIRLDYFKTPRGSVIQDVFHVMRVGMSILKDTFKLYYRLRELK